MNYELVKKQLEKEINIIFADFNINELSDFEKRKMIFNYLVNNLTYDFNELNEIKKLKNKVPGARRKIPQEELSDAMYKHSGICNAIAQYYKLLLDYVGIYSACIITDDGTEVNHQLNIVYDKENDSYSFDDITSVIVNRGTSEEFFDYNLEEANMYRQGLRKLITDEYWTILDSSIIWFYVGASKDAIVEEHNSSYFLNKIKKHKEQSKSIR